MSNFEAKERSQNYNLINIFLYEKLNMINIFYDLLKRKIFLYQKRESCIFNSHYSCIENTKYHYKVKQRHSVTLRQMFLL